MSVRVIHGDCRTVLPTLAAESVQCVVSSPPYWGLRDYGVEGQIGNEPTVDAWVETMVAVFREVRRVLRDDGTVFLNLGDAYANDGKWGGSTGGKHAAGLHGESGIGRGKRITGLKPKDLIGMPWLVAFALRADGWWLRSDIIWAKLNPMPESVRDRPTSAHEHVFLLTKNKTYFYDADAVRTPAKSETTKMPDGWDTGEGAHGAFHRNGREKGERTDKQRGHSRRHDGFNDRWDAMSREEQMATGANLRNVWTIATHAFPDAHFATFPPALVEPCIKAGTSERGCCPSCRAPWVRRTETRYDNPGNRTTNGDRSVENRDITAGFSVRLEKRVETTGWSPSCACDAGDPIPCTVLDPFGGSGTTGLVADRLGRNAVLIELNPAYTELGAQRIRGDAPLFASVESS